MREIWQRIESWLSQYAPPVLQSLRSGATEQEIASAETALGQPFPNDYRESLSLHDGQMVNQYGCSPPFTHGLDLFPLAKTISRRQGVSELLDERLRQDLTISTHGPVRPVWWDRLWIPFADDGNGNYCCLDLNPAAGGHVGQIIRVWNESHLRTVVAGSFRAWLDYFADELEAGGYVYSPAHNGLLSLEDAIADGIVR